MKNLSAKACDWISWGIYPVMIIAVLAAMEFQVASRQRVTVDGITERVNVLKDHTASFGLANVRLEDGRFMTHTGIPAGKGHWPIIYDRPSTPHETAVYRAIF